MAASWSAKEAAVWPLYLGGNVFKEFSIFVRYQLKINSHSEKFCWLPLGICQRCAVRPTPTKLSIEQSAKKGHNSQIGGGPHILKLRGGLFLPSLERGLQTLIYQKHTIQSSGGQRREGAPLYGVTTEVRRASCLFSLPPFHDFWASSLPPGSYHLIAKGTGPTRTGPRSPKAQSPL